LGQDLLRVLSAPETARLCHVTVLDRPDFDVTDPKTLERLRSDRFGIVVNTSAYNAVDRAETEVRECFEMNAYAPLNLARACRDAGSSLLHFSTDYVMSGGVCEEEEIPYGEESCPHPLSVYALSKATGERFLQNEWERVWIVRTCGLYGLAGSGQKGGNFVSTMIRLAREGKSIRVVSDQRVGPTSTADLAEALRFLLLEPLPFGIWHLTNAGNVSWYEFAREIFRISGLSPDLTPVTLKEYRPIARRSPFSVLSNEKARRAGITMKPWDRALANYLERVEK
jgi:dTDP-4-dehydrorhamnose reductase